MKDHIDVGDVFTDSISDFRIMAIVDGWIMAHRKGAMPFITSLKILQTKIDVIPKNRKED